MYRLSFSSRIAIGSLAVLFVLSLLAAAWPVQEAMAQGVACVSTHRVKETDNIRRIARQYKVTVARLEKANNLVAPYELEIDQRLCIPARVETNPDIVFTPTLTQTAVGVDGTNFRKQVLFYVRVRENDTSAFTKIGQVSSDKQGNIDERVQLPKELQGKSVLTVCLKNAFTDTILCRQAFRTQ